VRLYGVTQFLGYHATYAKAKKVEDTFRAAHTAERVHAREMNRLASIAYQQRRREERLLLR
jgi:hypothetical protein